MGFSSASSFMLVLVLAMCAIFEVQSQLQCDEKENLNFVTNLAELCKFLPLATCCKKDNVAYCCGGACTGEYQPC